MAPAAKRKSNAADTPRRMSRETRRRHRRQAEDDPHHAAVYEAQKRKIKEETAIKRVQKRVQNEKNREAAAEAKRRLDLQRRIESGRSSYESYYRLCAESLRLYHPTKKVNSLEQHVDGIFSVNGSIKSPDNVESMALEGVASSAEFITPTVDLTLTDDSDLTRPDDIISSSETHVGGIPSDILSSNDIIPNVNRSINLLDNVESMALEGVSSPAEYLISAKDQSDRPLSECERHLVEGCMHNQGDTSQNIVQDGSDSVTAESMKTLKPGKWLNDEVICYFLKRCLGDRDKKLCLEQPGRKRSHFFNSFFVQNMLDEKSDNASLRGKYNYKMVERWSNKVPGGDLFNLKYIFIPINLDNTHWTSAVIFMEEKRIQYYDSMGGTDMTKLEGLLQYLKDEFKAKKGRVLDKREWTLVNCTRDTPGQGNGFDCGVFTCLFADIITMDGVPTFKQTTSSRQRIALSIIQSKKEGDS